MSLEVTKKSSKLDAQATKEKKKHGRCYEWKRLEKNPYEMDEVHNERNGTENANEWWQY